MPLSAFEIAMAKVWANGLVILVAATASLFLVVRMLLGVPIAGSPVLFLGGVVLYLFFATALGIFLGTITRTMAQFHTHHPADHRVADAFRREHAHRKPAGVVATDNHCTAVASFCQFCPGDHLPRGWTGYRMAAVPHSRRHRTGFFCIQHQQISAIDRRQPLGRCSVKPMCCIRGIGTVPDRFPLCARAALTTIVR